MNESPDGGPGREPTLWAWFRSAATTCTSKIGWDPCPPRGVRNHSSSLPREASPRTPGITPCNGSPCRSGPASESFLHVSMPRAQTRSRFHPATGAFRAGSERGPVLSSSAALRCLMLEVAFVRLSDALGAHPSRGGHRRVWRPGLRATCVPGFSRRLAIYEVESRVRCSRSPSATR